MSDRILVRTSSDLRYFLAAAALIQDFANQIFQQSATGLRRFDVEYTIEIADDGFLFFNTLFPKLAEFIHAREQYRSDWDCVLDFRDLAEYMTMGMRTQKPMLETVGIAVGANPAEYPSMIFLSARLGHPSVDVLIDEDLDGCGQLLEFFTINHPEANVRKRKLNLRPANLFSALANAKIFIGRESGVAYLAASMGLSVIEVSSGQWPAWWLGRSSRRHMRMPFGVSPEMIWITVEEMWETIFGTNFHGAASTAPLPSIAAPVGEKLPVG